MTEGGILPAARRLTKRVRRDKIWPAWSGEGHPAASLRWLGRKPEGPGADPIGNDLVPRRTACSLRLNDGGPRPGGSTGGGA